MSCEDPTQEQDDDSRAPPTDLELWQEARLTECLSLLLDIVDSRRPVAGGFRERAREILVKCSWIDPRPGE